MFPFSFFAPLVKDLLQLFYPRLCPACEMEEPLPGGLTCFSCQLEITTTDFSKVPNNTFEQRFWGRVPLEAGFSPYRFVKGGKVQRMIHQLKYHNRKDTGLALGRVMGRQLRNNPRFQKVECIVPVPLHRKKLHLRGYNQSEILAKGMAECTNLPIAPILQRSSYSLSQTQKSREDRFRTIQGAFSCHPQRVNTRFRHFLLVDDVLTTGATLEVCAQCLLTTFPDARIYMATVAMAEQF